MGGIVTSKRLAYVYAGTCWPKQSVVSTQQHLGVLEKITGGPQQVHGTQTQHMPLRKGGLSRYIDWTRSTMHCSVEQHMHGSNLSGNGFEVSATRWGSTNMWHHYLGGRAWDWVRLFGSREAVNVLRWR